jgi:uncharacterized protein
MKAVIAACVSLLAFMDSLSASAQQLESLTIAAGPTDSMFYPVAGGLSVILAKSASVNTKVLATRSALENLDLLAAGKADIAFSDPETAYRVSAEKRLGEAVSLQLIALVYSQHLQLFVRKDIDIKSLTDLKGKRISLGPKDSETERIGRKLFAAAGLSTRTAIQAENWNVDDSYLFLQGDDSDRDPLDAFLCLGLIPGKEVADNLSGDEPRARLIGISEYASLMNNMFEPIYVNEIIPNGTYGGQEADVGDVALWNVLVVRSDTSVDKAYTIAKLFFENSDQLKLVREEVSELKLTSQSQRRSAIRYHPGALKYFSEKGVSVK